VKKIVVKNAREVGNYVGKLKEDFILISISNPDGEPAEIPENPHCGGILRLEFHDISKKRRGKVAFKMIHARKIRRFVENHFDSGLLVCNCVGGISRSPAVAAALAKVYNLNADQYFSSSKEHYIPNMRVYRMLLRVYGIKVDKSEIKRLKALFISKVREYAKLE